MAKKKKKFQKLSRKKKKKIIRNQKSRRKKTGKKAKKRKFSSSDKRSMKKLLKKGRASAKKRGQIKKAPKKMSGRPAQDLIMELVARGKERGFVTEDEIMHAIPNVEQNIRELEGLYEKLEAIGVNVMSSGDIIKLETDKVSEDLEEMKAGKKKSRKKEALDVPEEA
ncbi:RNA polymerase sigma factor region1.1 domain-containing protein, partial [Patescibacteria group bacterium]|nr:RNA polymerase sigma factor region1.1 domain-containing protein [Patescibacteria group bacterium]